MDQTVANRLIPYWIGSLYRYFKLRKSSLFFLWKLLSVLEDFFMTGFDRSLFVSHSRVLIALGHVLDFVVLYSLSLHPSPKQIC